VTSKTYEKDSFHQLRLSSIRTAHYARVKVENLGSTRGVTITRRGINLSKIYSPGGLN
jgi:hypothetical protein